MRWPVSREWEHVAELPADENALSGFVNGQVRRGRGELHVRRGVLWRRRVWVWRGRWKMGDLRGWDSERGDWLSR